MIDIEKLEQAIKASGYTKTEFAIELGISRYLKKETIVKRSLYDPICHLLGIDLVHLLHVKYEGIQKGSNEDMTTRRDILRYGSLVAASAFLPVNLTEEHVDQWENKIVACWALSRQGDSALLHLHRLLPIIEVTYAVSWEGGTNHEKVRNLAAQAHLLASMLALHSNNIAAMIDHCDQAIVYSKHDLNLLAAALIRKAVAHQYNHETEQMIHSYRQAYHLANQQQSPLLQGRAAAGLANALALQKDAQGVDRYLHRAHEVFPVHPEQDPTYRYADCDRFSLEFLTGLSHLRLDQPKQALTAFEQAKTLPIALKDRIEVYNSEAETAIALNDQERFISAIQHAVYGARSIQSQKRLHSSYELCDVAKNVWKDRRIQKLVV